MFFEQKYLQPPGFDRSDYVIGKIFVRRSYFCENIYQMKIFLTFFLPQSISSQVEKFVSLSEICKTLKLYKKPTPLN